MFQEVKDLDKCRKCKKDKCDRCNYLDSRDSIIERRKRDLINKIKI